MGPSYLQNLPQDGPKEISMKERWKRIYNVYAVSTLGRVKRIKQTSGSIKGYFFKIRPKDSGYVSVCLRIKNKPVVKLLHRLVAEAFLGKCPRNKNVNHRDGNKSNNCLVNLEYTTCSQNVQHAYDTNLRTGPLGIVNGSSKLCPAQVKQIRRLKGLKTQREIGKMFGISCAQICYILQGKFWKNV